MHYNKLVRDKIPEIIESNWEKVIIHIADKEEYQQKLQEKFYEEGEELFSWTNVAEELADVLEVVYAIGDLHWFSQEEIEKIRLEKLEKKGWFSKKIILEETGK